MYIFYYSRFEQLALALKNRVALEYFTVLKYILLFRIFEELAVALKTEFALKFFKPRGAAPPYALSIFQTWVIVIDYSLSNRNRLNSPNAI